MKKTPPKHWHKAVKDLWRAVQGEYALLAHHHHLLLNACEQLDRAAQAREALIEDGPIANDRYGSPKEHPAVAIERQATNQARLLLRELNLDDQALSTLDESSRIKRPGGYA